MLDPLLKSKNHRITEWQTLGTNRSAWSNSSRPCPNGFWIFARRETSPSLWAASIQSSSLLWVSTGSNSWHWEGSSCISLCACCLLYGQWAQLKRAWLLLYGLFSYFYIHWRNPFWTFTSPDQAISSLSFSSYDRYSHPLIILETLHWPLSGSSISVMLANSELSISIYFLFMFEFYLVHSHSPPGMFSWLPAHWEWLLLSREEVITEY